MYNGTKEANGLPYLISDLVVHLNDRKDVDDEAVHKVMKGIGKKKQGKGTDNAANYYIHIPSYSFLFQNHASN